MMKKNKFITILIIGIGFFWFMFYIYLWFIKKESNSLLNTVFIFLVLLQICYLYRNTTNKIGQCLIEKYTKYVNKIYKNPLLSFYEDVFKEIPYIWKILLILLRILCKLYNIMGQSSVIIFSILFFLVPKIIIVIIILFKVFLFSTNSIILYLLFFIPFFRIFSILFLILDDYAYVNKTEAAKYLIITTQGNKLHFNLNTLVAEEDSQEFLEEAAAEYIFFKEAYDYTQSTLYYDVTRLKPWFHPIFFGFLSISFTKLILNMFSINIPSIYLIPVFFFVLVKEYANIKKELHKNTKNHDKQK